MTTKKHLQFIPIIIALSIVIGILIGSMVSRQFKGRQMVNTNKISELLQMINRYYVDSINIPTLIEEAMPGILSELDPHSVYIPAKDHEAVASELEGSFSGIGIQFTIQEDTIHVSSIVQGGPSEKVGLMAGDRIVMVDDSLFVGKIVNNISAQRKLKGPKGTSVKIGVKRFGEKDLLSFTIVRGDVPQPTIDVAYMLNDKYGYVLIDRFGRNTHAELLKAFARLTEQNCQGLVIDLRNNVGGYLEAAIHMVNEFLPAGKLIVYTEGLHSPRSNVFADGAGSWLNFPVVVLIDEFSASSSEVFAGAIQDNDRGMIVGRRSFGKGLVQQSMQLPDGSEVRLTIARYYTPAGRCIQRPYVKGNDPEYEMDIYNRFKHGEFYSQDSIKLNKEDLHLTGLGRPVYGGGGIMPDIFVARDTVGVSSYVSDVSNRGLLASFAFQYTDRNRQILNKYTELSTLLSYLRSQDLLTQFVKYADSKGVKRRNNLIQKSSRLLERYIYARIVYNKLGMSAYMQYSNEDDNTVQKALELLNNGDAFPKAPESPVSVDGQDANAAS